MSTIFITGASRGIGKAIAEKFLDKGWQVLGCSVSGSSDIEHPNYTNYQMDVTNQSQVDAVKKDLTEQGIKLDILVNNAGILTDDGETELDLGKLQQTLDVNLFGVARVSETFKELINENGMVINISSMMSSLQDNSYHNTPAYCISKTALNMLTKVLASQMSARNIKVISLDPGWVKTDMGGAGATRNPAEVGQDVWEIANKKDIETGMFYFRGKIRSW